MAVRRETPRCDKCGAIIAKAIYKKDYMLVGDNFLRWEYFKHNCIMDIERHLKNYKSFLEVLREVIDYKFAEDECAIIDVTDTKFALKELGFINIWFDRMDEGDMWDYTPLVVSSYSSQGKKHYYGIEGEYIIFMAYPEDKMWDDTSIYIFSRANEVEFDEDKF